MKVRELIHSLTQLDGDKDVVCIGKAAWGEDEEEDYEGQVEVKVKSDKVIIEAGYPI